jgi:integrase
VPKTFTTDLHIKALKRPEKGQETYWDKTIKGFGVRISQGGAKTFILMHGKKRRRLTIGRYPVISLKDARDKVKGILAERTLGTPINSSVAFEKVLDSYFTHHVDANNRPRTAKETKRLLNSHFRDALEGRRLSEVTKQDITNILDKLADRPSEQRHAFVAIRAFLRWAVRRGDLKHTPLDGMAAPANGESRSRVLSLEELGKVYKKAGDGYIGTIIRLLIVTGQRRGEIAGLRGEYIDKKQKTIELPKELTKNKREHLFPIGKRALKLLNGIPDEGLLFPARGKDKPFNGWSKTKPQVDIPHWTLHDLRRSFSTQLSAFGVQPHVTERLLNHIQGSLTPIAQVYNKYAYLDEMREAINLWEKKLSAVLREKHGTINEAKL